MHHTSGTLYFKTVPSLDKKQKPKEASDDELSIDASDGYSDSSYVESDSVVLPSLDVGETCPGQRSEIEIKENAAMISTENALEEVARESSHTNVNSHIRGSSSFHDNNLPSEHSSLDVAVTPGVLKS